MEAFRLSREKYATPLSGRGAAIKGARWNSPGVELIYTAKNRSLAMAEVAVHLTLATIPADYVMVTIYLPDDISIQILTESELPNSWNAFPYLGTTQVVGDRFVAENKSCVLQIPSVVTQGDHNLLINPHHAGFVDVKITKIDKFPFDKRLFR